MLGKIRPGSDNWDEVSRSDTQKPRAAPQNDTYRKIERDRQRPPSKEEQEKAGVEEKKPRSVFDLSKQEKPVRKGAPTGGAPAKGKQALGKGMKEQSATEGAIRPPKSKLGEEKEEELFPEGQEAGKMEVAEEPVEEMVPSDEFAQTEEPPMPEKPAKPMTPAQPKVKQQLETPMQPQAAAAHVPKKGDKLVSGETKKEEPVSKKEKSKGEKAESSTSGAEKGVAATLQSPLQAAAFHAEKSQESPDTGRSATIRELAAQIIDRIQVMRKENQTSTIVTLRHPPILAGATITLTATDNAKKEFNISFANLSPDAKAFLDRKLKEDSLTETLDRKGIIVHNLTTSTEPEKIISPDAGQASRDRQEQQQEKEQRRQQFGEPEEEEQ